MTTKNKELQDLLEKLKKSDRRTLAKVISLLENPLTPEDTLIPLTDEIFKNSNDSSLRIAVSGPPGVGKSTFIQQLGLYFIEQNHKVAVLAIDPSSPIAGGSILGDKTRMDVLASNDNAFIRPSPNQGELGGVHFATHSSILACEYAGYSVTLIETVGVGQSEVDASNLCDLFILLHQPNSGDELQGIKKGIMEVADLIAVNKADIAQNIKHNVAELKQASQLMNKANRPEVVAIQSTTRNGIQPVIDALNLLIASRIHKAQKRSQQNHSHFEHEIIRLFKIRITQNKKIHDERSSLNSKIDQKLLSPTHAAKMILDKI